MDPAIVRDLVLLNASEEEKLVEVIWDLGSKFPESDLWQRHQAADAAIRELSKQGWIELFTMRWMPSAEVDYERIHPNAVPTMLQQPQSWYPDNRTAPFVERAVLWITDVGRAA
ncbi:MAG TPA: hypothetical protein VKM54_10420 [Myxococcota bacterium]|nr:hypothetical protein [Myxococcota bacterium]